jgi:succinate dehydrogenase/fumarate reductase flavoprotein subunit
MGPLSPVTRLTRTIDWTHAADVVVVGSGIAGLATVAHAADLGATAIVLEKGVECGGTSAKAAAGMMIPDNRFLREGGQADPKDDFVRFLARVGRPLLYDADAPRFGLPRWEYDLIGVYWDNAARSVERLEELDALRTVHAPDWPSYNEVPEDRVRFGRVLFTVAPDGEIGTGVDCIARLREVVEDLGVSVFTGHRVDGVFMNRDGEVIGVHATTAEGGVTVRARKAVVFASGGFAHNDEYLREYLGGRYTTGCSAVTGEGDFVPIARALGAPLLNMDAAWGSPVVYEQVLDGDPGLISNFAIPGDAIVQVNRHGLRVCNEKATYNDRTQSHFLWDPARAEYPNWLQFAIWDQRNTERFAATAGLETGNFIPPRDGRPIASAQRLHGARLAALERTDAPDPWRYIVRGETLPALAGALGERLSSLAKHTAGIRLAEDFAERLRSTIERFNAFARGGRDEDFARGETAIELLMHGTRAEDNELPNATMFPLAETGPYYATILAPGVIDTKGGPKVNARLQVLDGEDRPIPGLYGVGNCVASASGQAYWSGGSTFGPYIAFGYAAARSAVEEPVRELAGEVVGERR